MRVKIYNYLNCVGRDVHASGNRIIDIAFYYYFTIINLLQDTYSKIGNRIMPKKWFGVGVWSVYV